jgi:hypothetical protein
MTQFKNNSDINLYYTDTDSIYTDSILDPSFIDDKVLGKLKLENVCKKAIFLAPKMYFLKTEKGDIITKTKGLKHDIEITEKEFSRLLIKFTKIEKNQPK